MKHLRTFELNTEDNYRYYWLIPTDERFESALTKIGCDKKHIDYFLNIEKLKEQQYVFISNTSISNRDWGWCKYKGEMFNQYYEDKGLLFKGPVDITDYELDANKYNL